MYRSVRKETNYAQWRNLLTSQNSARACAEYLNDSLNPELPELNPDRGVFAFKDGVYVARDDAFYSNANGQLPGDLVACRYIDREFGGDRYEDLDDWYHIPTPAFQSIMEYQGIEEEAIRWAYALMGRMLYDLNDRDNWQVIPFFKGIAGSGKSTIGRTIKSLSTRRTWFWCPHRGEVRVALVRPFHVVSEAVSSG